MPAIVDHAPADGGAPISRVRIRRHPAVSRREDRQFLPRDLRGSTEVLNGCSGRWPASGRWPDRTTISRTTRRRRLPYAIDRYVKETNRLYGVLDRRLADRDVRRRRLFDRRHGAYPWIVPHERQGQNLDDFPHLQRWFDAIARPAGDRARLRSSAEDISTDAADDRGSKKILFGQTAASTAAKA